MSTSFQRSGRFAGAATGCLLVVAGTVFAGIAAAANGKSSTKSSPADPAPKSAAPADSSSGMILKGSEEGTQLPSLTVTGEDRVHFEFERPTLALDLDPRTAPGLEWGDPISALDRPGVDPSEPLFERSVSARSPYLAMPWFERLQSGAVTRFRPQLKDVESWRLTVADSRSDTLAVFEGKGKPPKEIAWDGAGLKGALVPPGITCSYVLEAQDRAGNRRNFVGQGFKLPPYRLVNAGGMAMLFSAEEIPVDGARRGATPSTPPPILLEAASWLNQCPPSGNTIEVKATARTFDQAKTLSEQIVEVLKPRVLGDPGRFRALTEIRPDAPERGTIAIAVRS